jgi:hypothetical protein
VHGCGREAAGCAAGVARQVQRRGAHQRPKSLHQPRAAQQAGVVRFRFIININIIIIIIIHSNNNNNNILFFKLVLNLAQEV